VSTSCRAETSVGNSRHPMRRHVLHSGLDLVKFGSRCSFYIYVRNARSSHHRRAALSPVVRTQALRAGGQRRDPCSRSPAAAVSQGGAGPLGSRPGCSTTPLARPAPPIIAAATIRLLEWALPRKRLRAGDAAGGQRRPASPSRPRRGDGRGDPSALGSRAATTTAPTPIGGERARSA